MYISADATDAVALSAARAQIERRYGQIHGVVSCALVMSGSDLARMDERNFRAGFAAKVDVSVRMAQVFGAPGLDWMLFFSSIQSFEKTRGQANYAAGCNFMDAFAHELERRTAIKTRVINWGYWGSIGFASQSSGFRNWIASAGMASIEPAEALRFSSKCSKDRSGSSHF